MPAFNCHPDFTTRYSIHKIDQLKELIHQSQSVLRSSGPKYQKLSPDTPMQLNRTQIFGHWPPRRPTKFHDSIENRAAVVCNQPVKLMSYFAKRFCSDFSTNDYGSWRKLNGNRWASKIIPRFTKMFEYWKIFSIIVIGIKNSAFPWNLSP